MAWPCISRACCIARFWNQLDKADISVPLVFTKYSEVTADGNAAHHHHTPSEPRESTSSRWEQEEEEETRTQWHRRPRFAKPTSPRLASPSWLVRSSQLLAQWELVTVSEAVTDGVSAPGNVRPGSRRESVMRQDYRPWKVRPEPSCKPKQEYTPTGTPFESESQYNKDYKAWPVQKRSDHHPWIPKGERGSQTPAPSGEEPAATAVVPTAGTRQEQGKGKVADALNRQIKEERGTPTSYRNEFRAYTVDSKSTKAVKAKQTYHPPETKVAHETSYNTTFKGQYSKRPELIRPGTADSKFPEGRRVRSLYSEFYREPTKPEKPSVQTSKPKKPPTHKEPRKPKGKHGASSRSVKKKGADSTPAAKPEDQDKAEEINNKLAEAKE
ncbi:microtubule-associated protein 6 homolog [Leucoraja erinacea]|uniref:microtubule-associated protein 6 homolog n=1 Tax=Leucoraja erinaceus TaxID=7782 RepID=UPI00245631BF|nr:microtubule-associated protein 6 homolog [Leucoraja erinacea]